MVMELSLVSLVPVVTEVVAAVVDAQPTLVEREDVEEMDSSRETSD